MTLRNSFTDQPNDKLLAALLHIAQVEPVYRKRPNHTRMDLELLSATVSIEPGHWPLDPAELEAVTEWAAVKCSIKASDVTVKPLEAGEPR